MNTDPKHWSPGGHPAGLISSRLFTEPLGTPARDKTLPTNVSGWVGTACPPEGGAILFPVVPRLLPPGRSGVGATTGCHEHQLPIDYISDFSHVDFPLPQRSLLGIFSQDHGRIVFIKQQIVPDNDLQHRQDLKESMLLSEDRYSLPEILLGGSRLLEFV
jgi:hypothetical protein